MNYQNTTGTLQLNMIQNDMPVKERKLGSAVSNGNSENAETAYEEAQEDKEPSTENQTCDIAVTFHSITICTRSGGAITLSNKAMSFSS